MSKLSTSFMALSMSLLMAGSLWAQVQDISDRGGRYAPPRADGAERTFPSSAGAAYTEGGGTIHIPENSGDPTPLVITTQNVAWDGSGSVSIPFNLNMRARVMMAVYRKGSNDTGATGPYGAWLRLVPQDLYVGGTPLAPFEAGNNTITWDGNDWEGNHVGAGSYEFDLIGYNDLDSGTIINVGGSGNAWGPNIVDTNVEPAEYWSPFQETPPTPYSRSVIGTDFIANSGAVEVWSVTAFGPEEERNLSGHLPDDMDPTVHWTSRQRENEALGVPGGVIKLTRNDNSKTMDVNESFGDNGISVSRGPQVFHLRPHNDLVYVAFQSGDLLLSVVEKYDKTSGDRTSEIDLFEYFNHTSVDEENNEKTNVHGPTVMDVNDNGIWVTSHNSLNAVHLDHDGNVRWVNRLGDSIRDWISNEDAAELGLVANRPATVGFGADDNGKMSYSTETHNGLGYQLATFGRDGTGLANVEFSSETGPFNRGNNSKHIDLVNDGGKYDGLYICAGNADTQPYPSAYPEMNIGVFVPYDLASGSLSADGTAVEELGPAGTPDSYSLGDAYPNPFNPETSIEFSVPATGHVEMVVYNAAGQQVASLVDEELSAGSYRTTWDALDASGERVASGVYFYRMQAGDFADTRAMTLLK